MPDFNRLTRGEFNPHRSGIAAADAAPPLAISVKSGVNTRGFKGIIIDVVLESGTQPTSLVIELLYWSPATGKFVKAISTGDTVTTDKIGQWKILDTADRIVYATVTTLTGGTNPKIGLYVTPVAREGQDE